MKKTLFVTLSCMLAACFLLPALLPAPVSASPAAITRTHIIKAIYFGHTAVLNKGYVVEWYYSPETKAFHWHRGAFVRYDSYEHQIGYKGPWLFLYIYI